MPALISSAALATRLKHYKNSVNAQREEAAALQNLAQRSIVCKNGFGMIENKALR